MAQLSQDRLVAKEVALGVIRESGLLPEDHIGLSIAPFKDVESDDVIFDYTQGLMTGLAPARAEDAESELAQKDDTVGTGRASVIDWALKDHYDASDVSRFREAFLLGLTAGVESFPLTIQRMTNGFQDRISRDTLIRRRKLDNRLEWLIMSALQDGGITYNDGKIIFSIDYQRPSDQTNASVTPWSGPDSDPIDAAFEVNEIMWNRHRIRMGKAIMSTRVVRNILNSSKFAARSGLAGATGPVDANIDPRYLIDGWGIEAALAVWSRATGIQPIVYDSVYRTRNADTHVPENHPFLDDDKIIFLPRDQDIAAFDDAIGFAATLTSPHPEGNWGTGYYEWEMETSDPWGRNIGTGIKAFPVFPHLEFSYVLKVL